MTTHFFYRPQLRDSNRTMWPSLLSQRKLRTAIRKIKKKKTITFRFVGRGSLLCYFMEWLLFCLLKFDYIDKFSSNDPECIRGRKWVWRNLFLSVYIIQLSLCVMWRIKLRRHTRLLGKSKWFRATCATICWTFLFKSIVESFDCVINSMVSSLTEVLVTRRFSFTNGLDRNGRTPAFSSKLAFVTLWVSLIVGLNNSVVPLGHDRHNYLTPFFSDISKTPSLHRWYCQFL